MLHIGKLIKKVLYEKRWTVGSFAKKINKNRNNIYDIFKRSSIDTDLLQKISEVLENDFFKYYTENLKKNLEKSENESETPPIRKDIQNINIKLDKILDRINTKKRK